MLPRIASSAANTNRVNLQSGFFVVFELSFVGLVCSKRQLLSGGSFGLQLGVSVTDTRSR